MGLPSTLTCSVASQLISIYKCSFKIYQTSQFQWSSSLLMPGRKNILRKSWIGLKQKWSCQLSVLQMTQFQNMSNISTSIQSTDFLMPDIRKNISRKSWIDFQRSDFDLSYSCSLTVSKYGTMFTHVYWYVSNDVNCHNCHLSVLQMFSWAEATSTRMKPSGYSLRLRISICNFVE